MIIKTDAEIAKEFPTVTAKDVARLRVLLRETNDSLTEWFKRQTFGDVHLEAKVVSALAMELLVGEIKNIGFVP